MTGTECEVEIEALGAAGDGVAHTAGGRVFVPLALPGERWRIRLERRIAEGWTAIPVACLADVARATPVCPHFGRCGGCRLQHLPDDLYIAQRRDRIVGALQRRGISTGVIADVRTAPLGSRRRLRLGFARDGGRPLLGFRRRGSHRLEPITVCPIARPELAELVRVLADPLAAALGRPDPAEVSLTLAASGIDLLLHAARPPQSAERQRLADLADRLDLARIAWAACSEPEPIVTRRQPAVVLGGVTVNVPPGAFLQATAFGERELAAAVADWSVGAARAVDLYAGLGTLTFGLAERLGSVLAVEGDATAAGALRRAAATARLTGVRVEIRDLARRPLVAAELRGVDLAVLDPPRAGASEQVRQLAAAAVPLVIYASCSPESFARDARVLLEAGYALLELRPIDQFRYAAEVELIALFARPGATERP